MVFWKTFLGMSGTEDSSQDDWELILLLIFWYLHNDIIFTCIQIYAQIHNLGFRLQTEKVGFEQLQTTWGASETFENLKLKENLK
jgi:hypothetical protein